MIKFLLALDVFLLVAFITFRLLGIILWSIVWVLSPIWIPIVILSIVFIIADMIAKDF